MSKLQLSSTLISLARLMGGNAQVSTVKFKGAALNRKMLEISRDGVKSKIHQVFNAGVLYAMGRQSEVSYMRRVCDSDGKQTRLEYHTLHKPNAHQIYEVLARNDLGVYDYMDHSYPDHRKELTRFIDMIGENLKNTYDVIHSTDVEEDILLTESRKKWGHYRLLTSTDSPAQTLLPCLEKIKQFQQMHSGYRDVEIVLGGIDIYDSVKNELTRIEMPLEDL